MKKDKNKKSSHPVIKGILWYITLLFVFLLLLTYLASQVNPVKFWPIAFISLLYPYLLVINGAFVIFWAFMRKWRFLVPLATILIGWSNLSGLKCSHSDDDKLTNEKSFKVLSYNVQNLSNNNLGLQNSGIKDKIVQLLNSENADLICLQELHTAGPLPELALDSMRYILEGMEYVYENYKSTSGKKIDAIVTFTRFPIIGRSYLEDEIERKFGLITDLKIGSDTVRVINVHLASLYFKQEDYTFLTELDLPQSQDKELKQGLSRVIKKMKSAYQRRARQAIAIREQVISSPYPVIVCGDFNDPPLSFAYTEISEELNDAFKESGKWFGKTYAGRLPSYRIDYILYDDNFISSDFKIIRKKHSDHFAITSLLTFTDGF